MKKHNKIEKRTNKYINKYIEPKKKKSGLLLYLLELLR